MANDVTLLELLMLDKEGLGNAVAGSDSERAVESVKAGARGGNERL